MHDFCLQKTLGFSGCPMVEPFQERFPAFSVHFLKHKITIIKLVDKCFGNESGFNQVLSWKYQKRERREISYLKDCSLWMFLLEVGIPPWRPKSIAILIKKIVITIFQSFHKFHILVINNLGLSLNTNEYESYLCVLSWLDG